MNELDADWWVSQCEGKWAVCVLTSRRPRTAYIKALCDDKEMAEQIVREHNIVREIEERGLRLDMRRDGHGRSD